MWILRLQQARKVTLYSACRSTSILWCQRGLATLPSTDHITPSACENDKTPSKLPGRRTRRHFLSILRKRVSQHISQKKESVPKPVFKRSNLTATQTANTPTTPGHLDSTWDRIDPSVEYKRIQPKSNVKVATLAHGLDKTLFNSGVHPLKDLESKKFLFSPYLESITQPADFDYDAIQQYITSSKDNNLLDMARNHKATYVGSTSSLSGALSHIYFKISNHRPVDISHLSRGFVGQAKNHTRGSRAPKTIWLRWKNGIYAVDADKSFDGEETVLSNLGRSMEKMLTMTPEEYKRYLKENSASITEEEKSAPEAYAYGQFGHFLLRSQLDCYHRKLPRRTFDLKTRATMPIRLDIPHYKDYYNYELEQQRGMHYSFEREYYDMMRSAFLKYNFQVRIGHMDGIMVTYHNTSKIFGFQYISRKEMDARLFGTSKMGDEVFKYCLSAMEHIFNKVTEQYPKQTLRLTFDASKPDYNDMRIYVEPLTEEQEVVLNSKNHESSNTGDNTEFDVDPVGNHVYLYRLETESLVNGEVVKGPVSMDTENDQWDLWYKLRLEDTLPEEKIMEMFRSTRRHQATVFLPTSDESPRFLHRFKEKRVYRSKINSEKGDDPLQVTTTVIPAASESIESTESRSESARTVEPASAPASTKTS